MSSRISNSMIVIAIVAMLALMLSAPSVSAQGAQPPQWNEGDSWALGKAVNVDQSDLSALSDSLNHSFGNGINHFDAEAYVGAWVLFKVADVTATEYLVQGKLAVKFTADANLSAGMRMPAPGKYTIWELPSVPKTMRNITAHLVVKAALVIDSEAILDKDSMALKNYHLGMKVNARVALDMKGVPDLKIENGYATYRYTNFSTTMTLKFDGDLNLAFSPALDMFDFPINVGDQWDVKSNVTITGSLGGQLDSTGLPEFLKDEIFKAEPLKKANITAFPIDLSKLINNDQPPVHNGTIGPITQEINAHLMCANNFTVTLPFYGKVDVYEIQGGSDKIYYSDDIHFLSSANISVVENVLPADMQMETMSPQAAEQQINEVSDFRADIAGELQSNGASSFGNTALIGGIVVVVIVAIMVASIIVMRRKNP